MSTEKLLNKFVSENSLNEHSRGTLFTYNIV